MFPEVTVFHRLLMSRAPLPIALVVQFIPLQVPGFDFPVAYNSANFSCSTENVPSWMSASAWLLFLETVIVAQPRGRQGLPLARRWPRFW